MRSIKFWVLVVSISTIYIPCFGQSSPAPGADSITGISNAKYIYKIQDAFRKMELTSYKMFFKSTKTNDPENFIDTTTIHYYSHLGMMKGLVEDSDSTIVLSTNKYQLMVNEKDSLISIANSEAGSNNFQLNILDSLFQATNISSLAVSSIDGTYNMLTIGFKPTSFYKDYKITYNKINYRISKILLKLTDTEMSETEVAPDPTVFRILEVTYSDYVTGGFGLDIFNENKYVRKDQYGKWVGNGAYARFQVVDNSQTTDAEENIQQ